MTMDHDARASVLRGLGATDGETEELLRYNENVFAADPPPELPLDDEPFVEAWSGYAAEARRDGALPALRRRLVQLRFPVAAGVSATEEYQAATRRGELPEGGEGTVLERPEALRVFLHPTPAGRVPVVQAGCRPDFITLLRALARRNEPEPVPASVGACTLGGFVNWDRVRRLRERFDAGTLHADGAESWDEAFAWVRERKEMYQDRLVLLAPGGYSGVPAAELGLEPGAWERMSLHLRLEHECAHYLTRRVLGSMKNALLDELLADYAGLSAAAGRFRADWLLRFLGVEAGDAYRPGGRLENYRGKPPLSDGAFAVLCALVRRAARTLEAVDGRLPAWARTPAGRARVVLAIAGVGVEGLASEAGEWLLHARVAALRGRVHAEAAAPRERAG